MATKSTNVVADKRGEILAELREVQAELHAHEAAHGILRSRWFAGVYAWVIATNAADGCGVSRAKERLAKTLKETATKIHDAYRVGGYMSDKKLNPNKVNGSALQTLNQNLPYLTPHKEATILGMIRAGKSSREIAASIRRGAAVKRAETAGRHLASTGKLDKSTCVAELKKAWSYWRYLQGDEGVSVAVYDSDGYEIASYGA